MHCPRQETPGRGVGVELVTSSTDFSIFRLGNSRVSLDSEAWRVCTPYCGVASRAFFLFPLYCCPLPTLLHFPESIRRGGPSSRGPNGFPSPSSELPPSLAPPRTGFLLLCFSHLCYAGWVSPPQPWPLFIPPLPNVRPLQAPPSPLRCRLSPASCQLRAYVRARMSFSLQTGAPLKAGMIVSLLRLGITHFSSQQHQPHCPWASGADPGWGAASHCFGC